ncbi:hypothetical protein JCM10207_005510 [Rhodosporidiobolus poonsookiae]
MNRGRYDAWPSRDENGAVHRGLGELGAHLRAAEGDLFCRRGVMGDEALHQVRAHLSEAKALQPDRWDMYDLDPRTDAYADFSHKCDDSEARISALEREVRLLEKRREDTQQHKREAEERSRSANPAHSLHSLGVTQGAPLSFRQQHYYQQAHTSLGPW